MLTVGNLLRFIFLSFKCSLMSAMTYKKSFLIQTIFMMINDGFFMIFWGTIFNLQDGNLNGITMQDILYAWSIPTIAFGITYFLFGGIDQLHYHIIEGGLDSFLTQPKNVFLNLATSRCDFSACGDFVYGEIIAMIAGQNLFGFLKIQFYALLATVVMVCAFTIIRCLAIWLGDVDSIARTYSYDFVINFSSYPERIFGKGTKFLTYTIIPAAYIVYIPARLIENFELPLFLVLLSAASILIVITTKVFKQVLRKYESGNSMSMRI